MEPKHIYTSTGVKFWRHPDQMISFLHGTGKSVISTHISPTSTCQLNCDYCSVAKRKQHESIKIRVIINYIETLIKRGLKAVILTGGGESTTYPQWNELIDMLKRYDLKFGLITNGVDLETKNLEIFDWIRISINHGVTERIILNKNQLKPLATIGMSLVYSGKNKKFTIDYLNYLASYLNAKYIRVIPNCLPEELNEVHNEIDKWIYGSPQYDTRLFMHQKKLHRAPVASYCPQAYFRPYLSEIDGGTIFPCDSVVLNNPSGKFEKKYALCKVDEIGDFLDRKIKQKFDPNKDCKGCVFYENVNMLHDWSKGAHQFHKYTREIKHEDFV